MSNIKFRVLIEQDEDGILWPRFRLCQVYLTRVYSKGSPGKCAGSDGALY